MKITAKPPRHLAETQVPTTVTCHQSRLSRLSQAVDELETAIEEIAEIAVSRVLSFLSKLQ